MNAINKHCEDLHRPGCATMSAEHKKMCACGLMRIHGRRVVTRDQISDLFAVYGIHPFNYAAMPHYDEDFG